MKICVEMDHGRSFSVNSVACCLYKHGDYANSRFVSGNFNVWNFTACGNSEQKSRTLN